MTSLERILFLFGCVCICVVVGQQRHRRPPNCALVRCARPSCRNPVTPPRQCCPRCPACPAGSILVRQGGSPVFCGGFAGTQCPRRRDRCEYYPGSDYGRCCRRRGGGGGRVKPGRCPRPTGFGTCVRRCRTDYSCPGRQKCCSNGCGRVCRRPRGRWFGLPVASVAVQSVDSPVIGDDLFAVGGVDPPVDPLMLGGDYPDNMVPVLQGEPQMVLGGYPPRPCFRNNTIYQHGDTFQDDCNTCTCNHAQWSCTEWICLPSLTGSTAVQSVVPPKIGGSGGHCFDVICPEVECQNRETPQGHCCPVYRTVYCDHHHFIPHGQCCSVL